MVALKDLRMRSKTQKNILFFWHLWWEKKIRARCCYGAVFFLGSLKLMETPPAEDRSFSVVPAYARPEETVNEVENATADVEEPGVVANNKYVFPPYLGKWSNLTNIFKGVETTN